MSDETNSLSTYLANLMQHIIKWKSQPEKRTPSWANSINHARDEITKIQNKKPKRSQSVIESIWESSFSKGKKAAEKEMQKQTDTESLTWQEVFEEKYELPDNYWKIWTVLLSIALLVWVLNK